MTFARSSGLCVGLSLAAALATAADDAPPPSGETKVVLRVSRSLLDRLTRQHIERDEPIRTAAAGAVVTGTSHISGVFSFAPVAGESTGGFDLRFDGTITTRLGVTRRPVNVALHGGSPLRAARRFVFDGTAFVGRPVCVDLCYHSAVDAVTPVRSGPLSPLVRRVAGRAVARQLPAADDAAGRTIRASVAATATRETDEIAGVLNDVLALQGDTAEVLDGLGVRVDRRRPAFAATDDAVLAGIGFPPGAAVRLPARRPPHAPVEVWVYHPLTASQELLAVLLLEKADRLWADTIKPKVRDRLARRSADLAKAFDRARHEVLLRAVPDDPDWHLIRLSWPGAGGIPEW